jgi:hypothetical protein
MEIKIFVCDSNRIFKHYFRCTSSLKVCNCRNFPLKICHSGLTKTTETYNKQSWCRGQGTKWTPPMDKPYSFTLQSVLTLTTLKQKRVKYCQLAGRITSVFRNRTVTTPDVTWLVESCCFSVHTIPQHQMFVPVIWVAKIPSKRPCCSGYMTYSDIFSNSVNFWSRTTLVYSPGRELWL